MQLKRNYRYKPIVFTTRHADCSMIYVLYPHTDCAPLDADLFCYERDFMLSPSDNNQAAVNISFDFSSRYLDELLNIDNPYFEQILFD